MASEPGAPQPGAPPPSAASPPAALPALPADPVRLEEATTGFSAFAPPDFALSYDAKSGIYELRSDARGAVIEHTHVAGTMPPVEAARAVVAQRGFEVTSEQADDGKATLVAKRPDGRAWTVVVRRDGPETLGVTGFGRMPDTTAPERPDDARVLEWVASSATGGKPVELPKTSVKATVKPIELEDFKTKDGMASGKVPAEAGWATGGMGGSFEAENGERGELHLGIPALIVLPGTMAAAVAQMSPGWPIAPLLAPEAAVVQVWPQLRNLLQPGLNFGGVTIEDRHPANLGPPYDAGLFGIRFQRAGAPWRGAMLSATAPIPGDERWLFYYSELAVPDTDDGSVSQALLTAAAAYDPSGSQAAKTAAAQAAMAEVTQTIQSMTTMKQQTYEQTNLAWSGQFRW
jgi:hypothetical protein